MTPRTVLPKRVGPDEAQFHALLVAGLARVAAKSTPAALAKGIGRTPRQLANIMGGSIPEAPAIFDALLYDDTALDELLAGYGLRLVPLHSEAVNDHETAAGVMKAMSELVLAHADGRRDHIETLNIAAALRPLLPALQAIVREADEIRGAA